MNPKLYPAPVLSVVICTYNRAQILADTLESLFISQHGDLDKLEVLVIDNNSTDGTRNAANEWLQRFPCGRYVFESRQGLSHARNAGLASASTPLIAYMDDDIYFRAGWAAQLLAAAKRNPGVDIFGGRIDPVYEAGRPEWLPDGMAGVYSALQLGDAERPLVFPETPIGANMIIRTEAARRIGGFDVNLGRKGTNLLSNEELEFFRFADQLGMRMIYLPDVAVEHRIPAERSTPEWFVRRYYWQGISNAQTAWVHDERSRLHLVLEALTELRGAAIALAGRNWNPRRIHWHYQALAVGIRAYNWMRIGRARRTLKLALTCSRSIVRQGNIARALP